jgi:hypothetical protein
MYFLQFHIFIIRVNSVAFICACKKSYYQFEIKSKNFYAFSFGNVAITNFLVDCLIDRVAAQKNEAKIFYI